MLSKTKLEASTAIQVLCSKLEKDAALEHQIRYAKVASRNYKLPSS
jgi:hypothetical protein